MNILVIAPHADDEILGVGGTIAKHIANNDSVYVCVVTKPVEPVFREELVETIRKETLSSHRYLGITDTFFLELPSVMLEDIPRYQLNDKLQQIVDKVNAEIVYIPHFGDMQKDHKIVCEAAMVALRPKNNKINAIYIYETLSETEWNVPHSANAFIPNSFVDISEFLDKKIKAMEFFRSQMSPFPCPRSQEAIMSLAKLRGSTVNVTAAEAFMLVREIR